ncbi:hypothetical protein TNCV_2600071 [Trichonephila clavipes]|nr:hypothetical protein TNCV_2600071 [Trichonephila clavipes]
MPATRVNLTTQRRVRCLVCFHRRRTWIMVEFRFYLLRNDCRLRAWRGPENAMGPSISPSLKPALHLASASENSIIFYHRTPLVHIEGHFTVDPYVTQAIEHVALPLL